MCARAKALPSAGCALPPAEGLFPSGPPALTTHHPSLTVPWPLKSGRAYSASLSAKQATTTAATFEIPRCDRLLAGRRPSRNASLPETQRPAPERYHVTCLRAQLWLGWGGGEGPLLRAGCREAGSPGPLRFDLGSVHNFRF